MTFARLTDEWLNELLSKESRDAFWTHTAWLGLNELKDRRASDLTAEEAEMILRCMDRCGAVWSAPDDSPWGAIRAKLRVATRAAGAGESTND